jgi:hypothetical protein
MLKTFKKYLESHQAQSIVEYCVIFIAFALATGLFITKSRQAFETHFQKAVTQIVK